MSTIILYKNNKTLRLPILKFITSNKRFDNDIQNKKEVKKNDKDERKDMTNFNNNKKILNLSTLQDLSLNSEKFSMSNNNEKAVQTIQSNFIESEKDDSRKRLFNILKCAKLLQKKEMKKYKNNDDNIIIKKDKIYKINKKNRKKLLENYSQINHFFNNVYFKKKEIEEKRIIDNSILNKSRKLEEKINSFIYRKKNNLDINRTQENYKKEFMKRNLIHLFHNDLIVNNLKKHGKIRMKKEKFNNDYDLIQNNGHRNNSLPNIFLKPKYNISLKRDKNGIIKNNNKFLLKKLKFNNHSTKEL